MVGDVRLHNTYDTLDNLIDSIKKEGGYVDQLILARALIESYNSKKYLGFDELENEVNECLGAIEVSDNRDIEFDINCLMHKVDWIGIALLCEDDEDPEPVIQSIKESLQQAVEAYKDTPLEVEYKHKYCTRCGALLKPNTMAYTEGYHFDSCI